MPEFRVDEIQANPFRHIDRYPIRKDKVTALRESLRTTGFWDNVVARVVDGKPQIAYGHHRLAALREEFGPSRKVNLITRDLTDELMLQVMARENLEEWGTSAAIEHETVRAVVEAYAEGKIELPKPSSQARSIRYAPSFSESATVADRGRPYTAQSVAEFLGWISPNGEAQAKVGYALGALQLIEEGVLSDSDFQDVSTKDAEAIVKQARAARAADEAAAQLARREAEEAARRAEQAERDREAAAERERAAKEARDREAAERASRERREAEAARRQAEKQQTQRIEQATKHDDRGRTRASTAGRAVSSAVRSGEGYRRAPEIAARAVPRDPGPLPQIETFTRRVASNIGRVLNPDDDPQTTRLDELVQHREAIPEFEKTNLITELRNVAARAERYAVLLEGGAPKPRRALAKGATR